jgi:YidC/Oxa1 family membrane protein insertase
VYGGGVSDAGVMYQLAGATAGAGGESGMFGIPADSPLSLSFSGTMPNGIGIRKTVQFTRGEYFFDVEVELSAPNPDGSSVWLEWASYLPPDLQSARWNPTMFVLLSQEGSITRLASESVSTFASESGSRWVSFGDNYFLAALIPQQPGLNSTLWKQGDSYFFRTVGAKQAAKFKLYAGPKSQEYFTENSLELQRSIDLGWFAFIGQPILMGIELLHRLLGNYGLAIILLTLILKTVLLPLTKTSFKSMKAMQDLQPELKTMRERFADDQARLNQETMALFKARGVNPMGGCFPVLIQIPIFLGMYNALRTSFHLRQAPFALWINDLAAPEQLQILGIPVPVMILIMGASMFLQQVTTPSTAPPEQQKMMLMMPVFFTIMFIIWPFPSGLVLYWLVNNMISIVQQMALRSERNVLPLQATVLGGVAIFGLGFLLTLL